jgi:hypothetical protein
MGRISNIHRTSGEQKGKFTRRCRAIIENQKLSAIRKQRHVDSPVSPFHRSCGTRAANFAAKAALMLQ